MFGVEPNSSMIQLGYDFSALEARTEAHNCYHYDDKKHSYCSSLTAEKPYDLHCYSEDTEILTQRGYILFGDLKEDDKVAQYWKDTKTIDFVKPSEIVWQDYTGDMLHFKSMQTDILVTPNHRMLLATGNKKRDFTAKEYLASECNKVVSKFITNGIFKPENEASEHEKNMLKIAVATQADGCFAKDCKAISYSFTKERKIERLQKLLKSAKIPFKVSKHERKGRVETTIRVDAEFGRKIRSYLTDRKQLILELCLKSPETICEEYRYWDGYVTKTGNVIIDSTDNISIDVIGICLTLSGVRVRYREYNKKTHHGDCYIYRASTPTGNLAHHRIEGTTRINYSGKIGCVAIPSTYVVVRRNGFVCVSGNTINAQRLSASLPFTVSRDMAKTVKYAVTYSAKPAKIASTLGISINDGKKLYNEFWEACKPLELFSNKLLSDFKKTNNKYIVALDGRKLPVRGEHQLRNSKFQSDGAIIAKLTACIQMYLLERAGLTVDFFLDDYKNKNYIQPMIAYHDEMQFEVSKKLLQSKSFMLSQHEQETISSLNDKLLKEEDKAVKDSIQEQIDGIIKCSDAYKNKEQYKEENKIHTLVEGVVDGKGFYVIKSKVFDLLTLGVNKTAKVLNLNVPLAIDIDLGYNWADCH